MERLKVWYVIIMTVVLMSGCMPQPAPDCKPVFMPQQCETSMPVEPQWSDENVSDRVDYTRAKLENSPKHKLYEYDLKAAINKCLK
jgi:hypothetical protein